jgi:hypothetical protein
MVVGRVNGITKYVPQLHSLVLNYCKFGGSSRGAR